MINSNIQMQEKDDGSISILAKINDDRGLEIIIKTTEESDIKEDDRLSILERAIEDIQYYTEELINMLQGYALIAAKNRTQPLECDEDFVKSLCNGEEKND